MCNVVYSVQYSVVYRVTYLEPVMSTAAPSSSASILTEANPLRSWHASITTSTRDVAVAVVPEIPLLLYLAIGVLSVLLCRCCSAFTLSTLGQL
jgi:hypothetical protein